MQVLERSALLVAQHLQSFQKYISYSSITTSLDNIAEEVLNSLKKKLPDHSIFLTPTEHFSYWKDNNIFDNYWNEAEGTQIMDTLEEYIFGTLNFRQNKSRAVEWNIQIKWKCIDYVLKYKYGQEIIIFIIYHSVARRLGLRCDIIINPNKHICLFWKPRYTTNSLENVRCFRINSNKFPDCLIKQQRCERFHVITATKMIELLFNLIQQNQEYSWEMDSEDLLKHNRFNWNMNLKSWSMSLKDIGPHCTISLTIKKFEGLVPNTRSEEVKYSVGIIVIHGNQCTNCPAGVIIGWNRWEERHLVKVSIEDRRYNPNVFPLKICSDTKQQTHYLILTENNEMCYVGEDDITLTSPKWIQNRDIGRYFDKFEGTHYVPNKALAKHYPQDAAVTAKKAILEN
ncbi:F-box only protein 21-like [Anoplolepis gracilipes]|uniref:F-box only protein 21-like n=1 Tax=Anoplolepis gracilipes TaxID=354296 RepID=UPI003BA37213